MNISGTVIKETSSQEYSADVAVDVCGVCGKDAEDVHHIMFQCTADSNNMINHIKRDGKSDLVPLL